MVSPSAISNHFVYYGGALVAHQLDLDSVHFEAVSLLNSTTPWLLFPFDAPSSDWTLPQYDDGMWIPMNQTLILTDYASTFIRVHFRPTHLFFNSLFLQLTFCSGIHVYVNGHLLLEQNVLPENPHPSYRPRVFLPLQPVRKVVSIPPDWVRRDSVVAVRLLIPTQNVTTELPFSIRFLQATTSLYQSFPSLPVTSNPSVSFSWVFHLQTEQDPASLLAILRQNDYEMRQFPFSITLHFPYPVSVSSLILYSSSENVKDQLAFFDVTSVRYDGTTAVLASRNHPWQWMETNEAFSIPLIPSVVQSLSLVVYGIPLFLPSLQGANREKVDKATLGRIAVLSETPLWCPQTSVLPSTPAHQCVLRTIRDSVQRGTLRSCCVVREDPLQPLYTSAYWEKEESHLVLLTPPSHHYYILFLYAMEHIQPQVAESALIDLEVCFSSLVVGTVTVYSVDDVSANVESLCV